MEPPIDRGWAWMCVLGAAICNMFFVGSLRGLGIVILEIMDRFDSNAATAAATLGVISGVVSLCAPIVNRLSVRYGFRQVVMIGGALFALSYMLLALTPNIYTMVLFFGVIGGIGNASIFGPPLVLLGQYFNKRRSFANGLATAGGSLGQLSLPLFTRYLLDNYGYQGGFLLYGVLALHTLPAAALFRPFSFYTSRGSNKHMEMKSKESDQKLSTIVTELTEDNLKDVLEDMPEEPTNGKHINIDPKEGVALMQSKSEHTGLNDSRHSLNFSKTRVNQLIKSSSHSNVNLGPMKNRHSMYGSSSSLSILPHQMPPADALEREQQDFVQHQIIQPSECKEEHMKNTKPRIASKLCRCCVTNSVDTKPWFEWSLFRNYLFVVYVCGICLGNTGIVDLSVFLPPRAMDMGIDKQRAALLLTILGACDFAGRIFGGWFADLGYFKRYQIMSGTLIVSGITAVICNYIESYISLVIMACVLGLIGGTYIALFVVVLVDFVGIEKLPSGSGLTIMCLGFVNIPMPSLIGALKDSTGSFKLAFTMLGCFTILGGLLFALEPVARRLEEKKKTRTTKQNKLTGNNPIYKPCVISK